METTLKGEFVVLRPMSVADAAMTLRWRQSARAVHLNRGAQSLAAQERWIASRPAAEYNFIIALHDGREVGMVSLCDIDPVNRRAEPGRFLIGEEEAVRGIPAAVEAMKLIYTLAFDQIRLRRVFGTISATNQLMIKWQKYMGMKEEGRLRQHFFINGDFQDALVYGLLDEEYRRVTLPRFNAMIAAGRRVAGPPSASVNNLGEKS